MCKWLAGILSILAVASLIPFALIAASRSQTSPTPALHPILDMDKQPKLKAQQENPMFADDRAMRPRLPGCEAREDLLVPGEVLNDPAHPRPVGGQIEPIVLADQAAYDRISEGLEKPADGKPEFVTRIPVSVSLDLLRRGEEQFNVYCAPCHGLSGYGDGMVARRAAAFQDAGSDAAAAWVAPAKYHTDEIRSRAVGNLYNTVSNGIRTMPAYGGQISVLDRWAIVAYVKALQRSQYAKPEDIPPSERSAFFK